MTQKQADISTFKRPFKGAIKQSLLKTGSLNYHTTNQDTTYNAVLNSDPDWPDIVAFVYFIYWADLMYVMIY